MPTVAVLETDPRYHHGDLRQTLITAALRLLTEEQNWDFSLREVARRAGVSHNAPYNHFRSKQELLAAVAAAGFDLLQAQMQEAAADAESPADALTAIGAAYVWFGTQNPAHYRLMFGAVLATAEGCLPAVVGEAAETAKALLRAVIRRGVEENCFAVTPEALDMAVLSAWSLVHGLTMLLIDGLAAEAGAVNTPAAEQIAAQVSRLLLNGFESRNSLPLAPSNGGA